MRLRAAVQRSCALWSTIASLASAAGCSSAASRTDEPVSLASIVLESRSGEALPLTAYRSDPQAAARLLVVRVGASWCGPCRWHAEHTRELIAAAAQGGVHILDVLVRGQDNAAPTEADFAAWADRLDGAGEVAADRTYALATLFEPRSALPQIAFVDRRELRVLERVTGPTAEAFEAALATSMRRVELDVAASGELGEGPYDDVFSRDQWDLIRDMQLQAAAEPDPTNAYADDAAAAKLGERLFFSSDLTPSSHTVSCGSCHIPELVFQDGKDQAPEGAGIGVRNTPSIVLAPEQRWQFWDGRADSSWSQATMPLEDPKEIASSRLYVAHAVQAHFAHDYEAIFGPLPALEDGARFPAEGRPGDAAWAQMTDDDRTAVDRVLVNVGKAIAAYERSLRPLPNALDRYAGGERAALNDEQRAGLKAFFDAGCAQCHYGSHLRDDSFHALGFPTGHPDRSADPGRLEIVPELAKDAFSRSGPFSDRPDSPTVLLTQASLAGAFKTPGLRGVGFTLPCGHGGSFGGLSSTLEAHRTPSVAADSSLSVGEREPWLLEFEPALIAPIVTFLKTLRVDLPARDD